MTPLLSKLLRRPQQFVDGIGMYRIVTLALGGLVLCSLVAGLFGWLVYSPVTQLIALVPAVLLALGLNILLAKLFRIHANHESALITALILFFLVIPQGSLIENWALYLAVTIAVLSKFLIVYRRQHIFNAAALGAVGVIGVVWLSNIWRDTNYTTDIFSWWVSNPTLFVPLLILGGLVVMKIRKWTPVLWFLGASLAVFLFEEWRFFGVEFSLEKALELFFFSWPALFLAFFMLTEPFTMPPTKRTQAFYGIFVGALMHTAVFSEVFPMTPEFALLVGNLAVYPFRIRRKLFLRLIERREIAENIYEFIFEKPNDFSFEAGQYLEWMLPHEQADSRGVRRYFTIASSPTESKIRLALKVVPEGSSYKQKIMSLDQGDYIIASQLAGDFVLPKALGTKLGFIAGGIGVTPFRSHIRSMVDSDRAFDTFLFYCCNTAEELAYLEEFTLASDHIPIETIPVIASGEVKEGCEKGYITQEILTRRVPDYQERVWYLSGPPPMVNAYTTLLTKAGVPRRHIVCDFFPGLG